MGHSPKDDKTHKDITLCRLQLFVLAYKLGNFLRRLGLPKAIKGWSLSSLQVKPVKMGGRMVRHTR